MGGAFTGVADDASAIYWNPAALAAGAIVSVVWVLIGFSLALKGAFLLLAVAGAATLWMAVMADMGASLIVIANALRLLRE